MKAYFLVNPFGQEDFQQRLVWHIPFVCQKLELFQQRLGET